MSAEIHSKSNAQFTTVALNDIRLTEPSIVKIKLNPADVKAMRVDGRDLLIELQSGEVIRIANFVAQDNAAPNELVLEDSEGQTWLGQPNHSGQAFKLVDWDDIAPIAASDAGGAPGSVLFPLMGVAAGGGIAAAAGGGSDDRDGGTGDGDGGTGDGDGGTGDGDGGTGDGDGGTGDGDGGTGDGDGGTGDGDGGTGDGDGGTGDGDGGTGDGDGGTGDGDGGTGDGDGGTGDGDGGTGDGDGGTGDGDGGTGDGDGGTGDGDGGTGDGDGGTGDGDGGTGDGDGGTGDGDGGTGDGDGGTGDGDGGTGDGDGGTGDGDGGTGDGDGGTGDGDGGTGDGDGGTGDGDGGTGDGDGGTGDGDGGTGDGDGGTGDGDTPPATPTAALLADTGFDDSDGITSNGQIVVSGLTAGHIVQYQTAPNGAWSDVALTYDDADGPSDQSSGSFTLGAGDYPAVAVRVVDAGGTPSEAFDLGPIQIDQAVNVPDVRLVFDSGLLSNDGVTNSGLIDVWTDEPAAVVEYRDGDTGAWTIADVADGQFVLDPGIYENLTVRVTDLAGNVSGEEAIGRIVVDKFFQPITAILANDTGLRGDGVTEDGTIIVGNVEDGALVQYLTGNAGDTWQVAAFENGQFVLPNGNYAALAVRTVDQAGNVSVPVQMGELTVMVTPQIRLVADTGASNTDLVTSNGDVLVENLPSGWTFEYRTSDSAPWQTGEGSGFELAEGSYPAVQVRFTDTDGHVGEPVVLGRVEVDQTPPDVANAGLAVDSGISDSDGISNTGIVLVKGLGAGETFEYRTSATGNWVKGAGSSFELPAGSYPQVEVRVVDKAGNAGPALIVGPIEVDITGPTIEAGLIVDDGASANDGVTSDGRVGVSLPADASYYEYRTSPTDEWTRGDAGGFELLAGSYAQVEVRGVDAAGNIGPVIDLGQIVVDDVASAIAARLLDDTGLSATDGNTRDGTIVIDGLLPDMSYEYSINGGADWTDGENDRFTLTDDGAYPEVQIRVLDGNGDPIVITYVRDITLDSQVLMPTAQLADDNGDLPDDNISNDATVNVGNLEDGATWEYRLEGGQWTQGDGTSFELPEGLSSGVEVRQTDVAGNVATTVLPDISISGLEAMAARVAVNVGQANSVVYDENVDSDVQVLGLLEGIDGGAMGRMAPAPAAAPMMMTLNDGGDDATAPQILNDVSSRGVPFTVSEGQYGEMTIGIKQMALLAVADAFRVEIVNEAGELVYAAVTENSLVGDVLGLGVLGLTGDDRLVARVPDLPPGDYRVIVRNDDSALSRLLNSDAGGISIENLGQNGALLGDHNQDVILDTVENALGGGVLGGTVRTALELLLIPVNALPLTNLVDFLSDVLAASGVSNLLDTVKNELADALLANTLTLLQKTTIYTQLTEYGFNQPAVAGNVLTDADGNYLGRGTEDAIVTKITLSDGTVYDVAAMGQTRIEGSFGVLTISADGSYSYQSDGSAASVGQTETFIYEISNGTSTDSAELLFEIGGSLITANGDSAAGAVTWTNPEIEEYFTETETLIGRALRPVEQIGEEFVLADGMKAIGTITVRADTAYNQSGYVHIEKLVGEEWTAVFTETFDIRFAGIGQLAQYDLSAIDLGAGTYRITSGLTEGISLVYVKTDMDVVQVDEYQIGNFETIEGNFLANDDFAIGGGRVEVKDPETGDALAFVGTQPVVVEGSYGTLTIYRNGDYEYDLAIDAPYFDTAVVDSFDYQLVLPNGQISAASIDITVEPQGAGVDAPSGARFASLDSLLDGYLGSDDIGSIPSDGAADYDLDANYIPLPDAQLGLDDPAPALLF